MQVKTWDFCPELYQEIEPYLPDEENYTGEVEWSLRTACLSFRPGQYNVIYLDGIPSSGSGVIIVDYDIAQLGWRGWSNVKFPTKTGFNFKYALPLQIDWAEEYATEMVITFNPHNQKLMEAFKRGIEGKRGDEMTALLQGFSIPETTEIFNYVEQYVFRRPITF